MREHLIERFKARQDLNFKKYIHTEDEEGALPVTYAALNDTFTKVDNERIALAEDEGKVCMVIVLFDGHMEMDTRTCLVLNTDELSNKSRLFDFESCMETFSSGPQGSYVFGYVNGCRARGQGRGIMEKQLGGGSKNLMLRYTAKPSAKADATRSKRELKDFLKKML